MSYDLTLLPLAKSSAESGAAAAHSAAAAARLHPSFIFSAKSFFFGIVSQRVGGTLRGAAAAIDRGSTAGVLNAVLKL